MASTCNVDSQKVAIKPFQKMSISIITDMKEEECANLEDEAMKPMFLQEQRNTEKASYNLSMAMKKEINARAKVVEAQKFGNYTDDELVPIVVDYKMAVKETERTYRIAKKANQLWIDAELKYKHTNVETVQVNNLVAVELKEFTKKNEVNISTETIQAHIDAKTANDAVLELIELYEAADQETEKAYYTKYAHANKLWIDAEFKVEQLANVDLGNAKNVAYYAAQKVNEIFGKLENAKEILVILENYESEARAITIKTEANTKKSCCKMLKLAQQYNDALKIAQMVPYPNEPIVALSHINTIANTKVFKIRNELQQTLKEIEMLTNIEEKPRSWELELENKITESTDEINDLINLYNVAIQQSQDANKKLEKITKFLENVNFKLLDVVKLTTKIETIKTKKEAIRAIKKIPTSNASTLLKKLVKSANCIESIHLKKSKSF